MSKTYEKKNGENLRLSGITAVWGMLLAQLTPHTYLLDIVRLKAQKVCVYMVVYFVCVCIYSFSMHAASPLN